MAPKLLWMIVWHGVGWGVSDLTFSFIFGAVFDLSLAHWWRSMLGGGRDFVSMRPQLLNWRCLQNMRGPFGLPQLTADHCWPYAITIKILWSCLIPRLLRILRVGFTCSRNSGGKVCLVAVLLRATVFGWISGIALWFMQDYSSWNGTFACKYWLTASTSNAV